MHPFPGIAVYSPDSQRSQPKPIDTGLKIISAILLICTFTLSQYARQLSYLECKFSNLFKSATTQCDCEKKSGITQAGKDGGSTPLIHIHIHPDEFFSRAETVQVSLQPVIQTKGASLPLLIDLSEGIPFPPWRPPTS